VFARAEPLAAPWGTRDTHPPRPLSQAPVYGCFKHVNTDFAQCRPKFGWVNHTEVLRGTCHDNDRWMCPSSWLSEGATSPAAKGSTSRASLASSDTLVKKGFWDYT
jgi:hypothetical protein